MHCTYVAAVIITVLTVFTQTAHGKIDSTESNEIPGSYLTRVSLWTLFLAPAVYGLYVAGRFVSQQRDRAKVINRFPHDPIHWLWGHINLYPGPNEAGLEFQRGYVTRYPRVGCMWLGNLVRSYVMVQHPDTVKIILKTTEPKPRGSGTYSYGLPWLGEGLLLSSGTKWARNRRLLTPAFHFDILKNYIEVKNRSTDIFLNKLQDAVNAGQSFEFFGHVSLLTLDIILRCSCSYENDVQVQGENHPYVYAVGALGDLWIDRSLKPWLHFEWIHRFSDNYRQFKQHSDYVHSISDQVINQRRQVLSESEEKRLKDESKVRKGRYLDFLDILLTARDEDGAGLTDLEIRNEVDTFLFEGHDTTASSISWTLYSLAEHPEHQKLCQKEIDEIMLEDQQAGDDIKWEYLPKLKYLTLCIKESMRCHCPVPFIEREVKSEGLTIEGITLPKDTIIGIPIYNLHHNPAIWDQPMEFRPSRFLPENIDKIDNFAFVPFSAGPRNCIGQNFAMHEQKIILARILHRYDLELDPDFKVEKKIGVVIKTMNGMMMRARRRST